MNQVYRLMKDIHRIRPEKLSMGISASGKTHIGTLVTALPSLIYLTHNVDAHLTVTIHDMACHPRLPSASLPFKYKKDPTGKRTMAKTMKSELESFLEGMGSYLNFRPEQVSTEYMSDILVRPDFKEGLLGIINDRQQRVDLKRLTSRSGWQNMKMPINPVCPSCDHISKAFSTYVMSRNEFKTECANDDCHVEKYSVKFENPQTEYAMFYLLNLMRLSMVEDRSDVHFCGGDKLTIRGSRYNGEKLSILERGQEIMKLANPNIPDIYVGPQINYRGKKLSKSQGTAYTLCNLMKSQDRWEESLMLFYSTNFGLATREITQSNLKSISRTYRNGHRN